RGGKAQAQVLPADWRWRARGATVDRQRFARAPQHDAWVGGMRRRAGGLAALFVLSGLLASCLIEPIPGFLGTIIAGLLVIELDRSGQRVAVDLVWIASRTLPA